MATELLAPLPDKLELEQKVKKVYTDVALHPEQTYHFEMGRPLALKLGYPVTDLDRIPAAAVDSFAGVGWHCDFAAIRPGDLVLDLGSGSGMDAFMAARQIGRAPQAPVGLPRPKCLHFGRSERSAASAAQAILTA